MFDRFTDRARKVMSFARQEAERFNHDYIGTEHILLGLLKEGGGVAANVLENLHVDLGRVRLQIEELVKKASPVTTTPPPDPKSPTKRTLDFFVRLFRMTPKTVSSRHPMPMPFIPRAKKVLEFAIDEARALDHNYVGTEHLLLGLLREQEGLAAQVLMNLGLKLDDVRKEVLSFLGVSVPQNGGALRGAAHPSKLFPAPVTSRGMSTLPGPAGPREEVLLLALLANDSGFAAQVLTHLGLKIEDVRKEIIVRIKARPKTRSEG